MQLLEAYGVLDKETWKEIGNIGKTLINYTSKKNKKEQQQPTTTQKDPLEWERYLFKKLNEWIEHPEPLYEDDKEVLFVAKIMGIKEQKIIELITKNTKNFEVKIYDESAHSPEWYDKDDYAYLPELKDKNGKICVIASAHHMLLYSNKRRKFISCLSGLSAGYDDNTSPYKWIDVQYDDIDVANIKKVGKELGYIK